ncbi:MAG: N-acetyltransferase [Sphingobacteriales bacterium]|nr:MAG: N-acetyltransferase [Sphingobacteriales bacterium]
MSVTIRKIDSKSDFKKFVQLPFDLYKDNAYWVPPIKDDELKALSPETNPAFKYTTAAFWLAEKDGKVVGRVGAIISPAANEKFNEKMCRVSRIEFIDDATVVKLLLDTVEQYALENGMDGVHGPLGFTNLDHQAMLVEGFDQLPSIASEYHLPYYHKHLEALGYEKEIDWVEFKLKVLKEIPEKAVKLNDLIKKRYNLTVKSFDNKEDLKKVAIDVFHLLNTAFEELFSFVPMPDDLLQFYINKYIEVLNPKFVKVVLDKDEKIIGFIISLPSLSEAMQKANGKLFPFGFIHITKALKNPKVADLLLTGIHPDWQAQGVSALLITELQQIMIEHGVEWVETTGMIETNEKAINHWKNYEHIQHKRKRCYRKMLK